MKTLEMKKATGTLAEYAKKIGEEPIILTVDGKLTAALISIENADLETITLSTNSDFIALIERSRKRYKDDEGISSDEVRRQLGIFKQTKQE